MNILFIGDVFSKIGRQFLRKNLEFIKSVFNIEFCIGNTENAAGGFGITPKIAEEIFRYGVDIQTSGNHIWDKKEIIPYLEKQPNLLRPANYPEGTKGNGYKLFTLKDDKIIGVINLIARIFMNPNDCPFNKVNEILNKIYADYWIVDFHSEATSEKQAMGFFLDGKVTAVIGTHTHVQTADEKILPNGTGYISDVGMTGPYNSIIGSKVDIALNRILSSIPYKLEPAKGLPQFNGVVLTIDDDSKKLLKIERINFVGEEFEIKP